MILKKILILALLSVSTWAGAFETAVSNYNTGNYVQALNSFYALAKEGDADAQYNVGLIYANGKGVKQDMAQAMEWYEKAAKAGQGDAAYNLGIIYYNMEESNPQRYDRAKRWYTLAAEKGVSQAENNLASMYLDGKGGEKNSIKALGLFKSAAEKGNVNAQLNVAVLYAWGKDVPNDKMKAYANFKKALTGGKSEASGYLDKLCKESVWVCKN